MYVSIVCLLVWSGFPSADPRNRTSFYAEANQLHAPYHPLPSFLIQPCECDDVYLRASGHWDVFDGVRILPNFCQGDCREKSVKEKDVILLLFRNTSHEVDTC